MRLLSRSPAPAPARLSQPGERHARRAARADGDGATHPMAGPRTVRTRRAARADADAPQRTAGPRTVRTRRALAFPVPRLPEREPLVARPGSELAVWRTRDGRHRRPASRAAGRTPARPANGPIRGVSAVLLLIGVLLLADAVVTLVWQEPLTGAIQSHAQARLRHDFTKLESTPPDLVEQRALSSLRGTQQRIAFLARALDADTAPGAAVGKIVLPRLHKTYVVVKGSDAPQLRLGPGTYDDVPFPGVPGTAAIAGHRTTYGAPFRELNRMRIGDSITVAMPYATFRYRVERTRIVQPNDLSILARRHYDRLVLSACHPLFSLAQRIVVFGRLESTLPRGLARDLHVPPLASAGRSF